MQQFRSGDEKAFATIYRYYARPLRFFAEQLVNDTVVAEDITAEAFARTFRRHTDFLLLEKLKAYLYITVNNAALDHLKTEKRHQQAHEQIRYLAEGEMGDVELAYIRAEAVRAVHQSIELLPEQSRKVIRMLFIEGKKLPEIAAELGLSYNTVQNYRARGLDLMRTHLVRNKLLSPLVAAFALSFLEQL
ncbi:MAG: sigma-70 family RNA polymerase sigma factor [Candidatus Pseudobacter hemicellulosilyticus]|uniref:Sigma-70 family RNA polymerase sigma factor n=1 Tax=Candidatus Pseudobacter hemicellulosilyticus TaxID=3121375 RepID=A0AAJ5WUQ9_9BACT|nr:MAG: sigma-70 family RNA polymerase sigma factor [Pseudobacter sp.]